MSLYRREIRGGIVREAMKLEWCGVSFLQFVEHGENVALLAEIEIYGYSHEPEQLHPVDVFAAPCFCALVARPI